MRTVTQVAELANITVRTLHHYDDIGLLRPGTRSDAGYRLYDRDDLERLQEILFYRELGFSLAQIRAVMDDPGHDRASALRRQRELLRERIARLEHMAAQVEKALLADGNDVEMKETEMFEAWGDFDPSEYEDEVKERWGGTPAYRQSQGRTSEYGGSEWQAIKEESDAINERFVALLGSDADPRGEEAMDVAEAHRQHIGSWFYDCPPEMHAALGEMYVEDPRFTAHYEEQADGLAAFVRDAIVANADRGGVDDGK